MSESKKLPTHDFHAANGARFVPFGGWEMPVQYTSILDEHRAVREKAGLFDVSHMGEFHVSGPDAAAFLDRLLVNAIEAAADGKAVYSPMCYETGGTVDDLIVYRIASDDFLVCVNAANTEKDFEWFTERLAEWYLDVELKDVSSGYALLALQGPKALDILSAAGIEAPAKRFSHEVTAFDGAEIRICRTGYTGEDGVEIFCPSQAASGLAEKLLAAGTAHGLQLCGLGARNSLRLEAGFPLYGHELSDTISPLEAGLGWTVKLDKASFVGRDALATQKERGVTRRIVHFTMEGRRIAREGTVVNSNGCEVGTVVSGTLSPMIDAPIGSALIDADADPGSLSVDLRGNEVALVATKPPLYKP